MTFAALGGDSFAQMALVSILCTRESVCIYIYIYVCVCVYPFNLFLTK